MKKYLRNAARAVQAMLVAVVLVAITSSAAYSYCDWVTINEDEVVANYGMSINRVEWNGTFIQDWNFEKDAGGNYIVVAADYTAPGPPYAYNCIHGKNGFTGVVETNPVPAPVERGATITMTVTAGAMWLMKSGTGYEVFPTHFQSLVKVYVDWNNDGTYSNSELAGKELTPGMVHKMSITVPANAASGRLTMRVCPDYGGMTEDDFDQCSSNYFEAREYLIEVAKSPYDAGIATIVSPAAGKPIEAKNYPITVRLRNDGTVTMTSCDIKWSINGLENTYAWTGSLLSGASIDVTVGNYTFTKSGKVTKYNISASSSKPNGQIDDETANDTYQADYGMKLSPDTYYIGGTGADFASVSELANALSSYTISGDGDFIFYIRPGNYDGQAFFDGDMLDHKNNTFLFEQDPEVSGALNFTHTITGYGTKNYIWKFNNLDKVTIKNLNFTVKDPNNGVGSILTFQGNCGNLHVEGNTFNGVPNTISGWYTDTSLLNDIANTGSNITCIKNIFNDGGIGWFSADDASVGRRNIVVDNNKFNKFSTCGVRLNNILKGEVSNCNLVALPSALYGIFLVNGEKIYNNAVSGFIGNATGSTGIYCSHTTGVDAPAYITKNTVNGSDGINGISVFNIYGGSISNNVVNITNLNTALISGLRVEEIAYDNSIKEARINIENNNLSIVNGHGMFLTNAAANIAGNTFYTKDINAAGNTAAAYMSKCDAFLATNEVITNDFGFYNLDGTVNCAYNSIQATGTNQAFYHAGTAAGTSHYYRNQFVNTGAGLSFFINDLNNKYVSKENNFYAKSGMVGIYNGTIVYDFETVRTKLGVNSRSEDPFFVSNTSGIISRYNENMYYTYTIKEMDKDFAWPAGYAAMYEMMTINGKSRDGAYYIGAYNVYPKVSKVRQSKEMVACAGEEDLYIYCSGKANAGAQPMYRWFKDGVLLAGKEEYKLIFDDFDYTTSGVYTCEIYTPGVTESVWSDPISVYVLTEPEITTQPMSEINAVVGEDYLFTVDAHYRGIVPPLYEHDFQWFLYDAAKAAHIPLADDAHFGGVKSKSLSIVDLTAGFICQTGDYYYCKITAQCGVIETEPFIISQKPEIVFQTQPKDKNECAGQEVKFTAKASVPENFAITYQWQYNGSDIMDNAKYNGATTRELTIFDIEESNEGAYTCVATIENTTDFIASMPANLLVKEELMAQAMKDQVSIVRQEDGELEVEILSGMEIEHITWIFRENIIKEGDWDKNDNNANMQLLKYAIIAAREKEDNGEYKCIIKNECEEIEVLINVDVPMWGGTSAVLDSYNGYTLYTAVPNPTNKVTNIKFDMAQTANATVTLSDVSGRTVATLFDAIAAQGMNTITLDVDQYNLTTGVYYYTIVTDGFTATHAIVISK